MEFEAPSGTASNTSEELLNAGLHYSTIIVLDIGDELVIWIYGYCRPLSLAFIIPLS